MCIIIAKPHGVPLPDYSTFQRCNQTNNDGAGYMYIKDGSVRIRKGFSTALELYDDIRGHITDSDVAVIHFRMATHGNKDVGNCHPFPLTSDVSKLRSTRVSCDIGLAHNGVFHIDIPHKKLSDTQAFVQVMSEKPDVLTNESHPMRPILDMAIEGSKLAVLCASGRLELLGNGWIKDEGLYYSNYGFRDYTVSVGYGYSDSWWRSEKGGQSHYPFREEAGEEKGETEEKPKETTEEKGTTEGSEGQSSREIGKSGRKDGLCEVAPLTSHHNHHTWSEYISICPICGDYMIDNVCLTCMHHAGEDVQGTLESLKKLWNPTNDKPREMPTTEAMAEYLVKSARSDRAREGFYYSN